MNMTCESMRDRLPELANGQLSGAEARDVRRHAQTCGECGDELAVLEALAKAPPAVPEGLETRIQLAVRAAAAAGGEAGTESPRGVRDIRTAPGARPAPATGRAPRRLGLPGWTWAVAAVLALLLGRGVWTGGSPEAGETDLGLMALASGEYSPLPAADGVVAGAPLLDGLSEDDLNALLEDWDG